MSADVPPAPLDPDRLATETAWLRDLAHAVLGTAVDADDLAQDAMVTALTARNDAIGNRRGWLAAVVRHRAIALARRDARRRAVERDVRDARAAGAPDPADLCARVELHRLLADEVLALEERYRTAIVLRFFADRRPQKIARQLGVPVETVKSRIARGLRQLRGRLSQRLGGDDGMRAALVPLALARPSLGLGAAVVTVATSWILMKSQLTAAFLLLAAGATAWLLASVTPVATPTAPAEPGAAAPIHAAGGGETTGGRDEGAERVGVDPAAAASPGALRVEVVDAAGRPVAGVPVRIHRNLSADQRRGRLGGAPFVIFSGATSGADGIATIPWPLRWHDGGDTGTLLADIHAPRPPSVTVSPATDPSATIRLTLPATGTLVVRFEHDSGEPVRVRRHVRLSLADAGDPDAVLAGSRLARALDGVEGFGTDVTIPLVELGLRLKVTAAVAALDIAYELGYAQLSIDGPSVERQVVECRIGSELPLLRGRLLLPDGDPARRALVHLRLVRVVGDHVSMSDGVSLRTDAGGRFVIPAGWHERAETSGAGAVRVRRDLYFVRRDQRLGRGSPVAVGTPAAVVALPEIGPRGNHELGVIRLVPLGVLAQGKVVDPAGDGVAGVALSLREPDGRKGRFGVPAGLTDEQRTDSEGRFSIAGLTRPSRLTLHAWNPRFLDATLEVPVGAAPVTVRMQRAARLLGSVAVDDGIPEEAVTMQLVAPRRSARSDAAGTFRFERVVAGKYRVVASLRGRPLAEVGDVVVRDGEDCRDPRLDPLDLRGRMRVVPLELRDPEGRPIAGRNVRIVEEDAPHLPGFDGQTDAAGRCTWFGVDATASARLEVPGYVSRTVDLSGGAQRVVLAKCLELTVSLDDATPSPGPSEFYRPELTRLALAAGSAPADPWSATGELREARSFTFQLPGPGRYRLAWRVGAMRGVDGEDGFRVPIHLPAPDLGTEEIDVRASREVRVRLHAATLQAVQREVERRRAELLRVQHGRAK